MRVLRSFCVPAVLFSLACGGGDGGGPSGPNPAIALSLSASSGTVVQGGTTTVTGTLTRSGGFTGPVSFTVEGAPAGVTGTVGTVQTTGATSTATITLQATPATPVGSSTLTVRATGSGVNPGTQTFQLTVTELPDFSVAVLPASASMVQGTSRNDIAVTLTRVNHPDAVTLSLGGPVPAGVTASFAPAAPTTNSSTMTLAVGLATPVGTYTLGIVGAGTAGTRSTPFVLTVTAPGSFALSVAPPGQVTVFQGAGDNSRTVTIARTNYPAPVTLSAENLPPGLTAAFAGNPVGGTSSVMTLTAGASVVPGDYTITIRGTGPAALKAPGAPAAVEAATTLDVRIATLGSFTMAMGPVCTQGITLSQSELDDSRVITFTRTNFPVGIQLTAEGLPAGMTATFSPNPATGNTARLSLTAGETTPVGNYTVTIRATGPASQATVTLPVAVSAETPDLLDLDYPFNSDLEHWLPGLACATTFQGDWGYLSWAAPGYVQFDGVGNNGSANAWISKLQSIPADAHTLQFDAAGFIFPGSDAVLRVRIVDAGVSTTLFDQVIVGAGDPPAFTTRQVDVRPWAGKTVRIYFEQDANPPNSHEHLFVDNIRILSGLSNAWQYRKQVGISTGASAAPAGYSIPVTFDHAALVAAGKSLANGDDVRIVYTSGGVSTEIDRRLERGSAWNSATTRIWFATQAGIGASQNSGGSYYLYYGNPAAVAPPSSRLRIFLFEDDFENGNLNRWTQAPAAAWVADNTQAHAGSFSVKYPAQGPSGTSLLPNLPLDVADVYLESWWYLGNTAGGHSIGQTVRVRSNPFAAYMTLLCIACGAPNAWWEIGTLSGSGYTKLSPEAGTVPAGAWVRVGTAMQGTTMRTFINGTETSVATGLTQIASGGIALNKNNVPAGSSWWVDDVVVRRYVFPEPGLTLGSEQAGPFPAALLGLQRAGPGRP